MSLNTNELDWEGNFWKYRSGSNFFCQMFLMQFNEIKQHLILKIRSGSVEFSIAILFFPKLYQLEEDRQKKKKSLIMLQL